MSYFLFSYLAACANENTCEAGTMLIEGECQPYNKPNPNAVDPRVEEALESCPWNPPVQFDSSENLECGYNEWGIVQCPWTVDFYADATFKWTFSEEVEYGQYYCNGRFITGLIQENVEFFGSYNPSEREFMWDSILYQRMD